MAFRGARGVKNTSSGSRAPERLETAVCLCVRRRPATSRQRRPRVCGVGPIPRASQLSCPAILSAVQTAPLPPREQRGLREKAGGREKKGWEVGGCRATSESERIPAACEGGARNRIPARRDSLQLLFLFLFFSKARRHKSEAS